MGIIKGFIRIFKTISQNGKMDKWLSRKGFEFRERQKEKFYEEVKKLYPEGAHEKLLKRAEIMTQECEQMMDPQRTGYSWQKNAALEHYEKTGDK